MLDLRFVKERHEDVLALIDWCNIETTWNNVLKHRNGKVGEALVDLALAAAVHNHSQTMREVVADAEARAELSGPVYTWGRI